MIFLLPYGVFSVGLVEFSTSIKKYCLWIEIQKYIWILGNYSCLKTNQVPFGFAAVLLKA